jgi:hypothetical protein
MSLGALGPRNVLDEKKKSVDERFFFDIWADLGEKRLEDQEDIF